MRTAKLLPKSSSLKPKKRCTRRRWPVEETGMNSVNPSTTPRMIALRKSNVIGGAPRRGASDDAWQKGLAASFARLVTAGGDCGNRYDGRQSRLGQPPAPWRLRIPL